MTTSSPEPEPEPTPKPEPEPEPEPTPESEKQPDNDSGQAGKPASDQPDDPFEGTESNPSDERATFQQINNFYETVTTNGIGVSGRDDSYARPSMRRESGQLSIVKVTESLRYYLPPVQIDRAFKTLTDCHLVALNAPDGVGKKAATLELARRICPDAEYYTVLPPTRSLAELAAAKNYKAGNIYLLHDWIPARVDSGAAAEYDLQQLLGRLDTAQAYLAITFEGSGRLRTLLGHLCHRWPAPDPAAVLEHAISMSPTLELTDEQSRQLKVRAEEVRSPRLIVRLIGSVKENGVGAALEEVGQEQNTAVKEWFASEPVRWQVWSITALTFLSGIGEHSFDRMLTALTELGKEYNRRPADSREGDAKDVPNDNDPFPQNRWKLANDASLATFISERDFAGPVGMDHHPSIRSKELRLQFMTELNIRYGDPLWTPVRKWLLEMADEPFGDAQVAAGYGLALLARCALQEVEYSYLMPWSTGALRHRLMAVNVLWAMAEDDKSAPAALRIAVNWVWNKGQERAITAAIALGGPLGIRYPDESLRWLWALSLRSERIAKFSRLAVSHLFAVEADSGGERGLVLPYVLRKVKKILREEETVPLERQDEAISERRSALSVANSILSAPQLANDTPVVVSVLRARPADNRLVSQLWVATLNSVPHRKDAIKALHLTLLALTDDASSVELATGLGTEILPRLSSRAYEVLRQTLADPERAEKISKSVVAAFLAAQRPGTGDAH